VAKKFVIQKRTSNRWDECDGCDVCNELSYKSITHSCTTQDYFFTGNCKFNPKYVE
jgi:hypothetical protein